MHQWSNISSYHACNDLWIILPFSSSSTWQLNTILCLIKSQMYPISFIEESMRSVNSIWLRNLWIAAVHANYTVIQCMKFRLSPTFQLHATLSKFILHKGKVLYYAPLLGCWCSTALKKHFSASYSCTTDRYIVITCDMHKRVIKPRDAGIL